MPVMAPDIGIDLGTETTSVYVRGRGIVISEPSLVVLERENRKSVRAVGDEASFLLGRSPDQLVSVSPIRNGQVADFDLTELMIRYFLRKAVGVSYLNKPRVIVSVPCGLNDVSRKAMTEAADSYGLTDDYGQIAAKTGTAQRGDSKKLFEKYFWIKLSIFR